MNQAKTFNADSGVHANAIQTLAEQYHIDEAMVKSLYESELSKLIKQGVRITAFLPVLCVRHVKQVILLSRSD